MLAHFKFATEKGAGTATPLTPSLLYAYQSVKHKKIEAILLGLVVIAFSIVLLANCHLRFCPQFATDFFYGFSSLLAGVSLVWLCIWVLYRGKTAVLVTAAISIVDFDKYIDEQITNLETMLSPINLSVLLTTKKQKKYLEKALITAQKLKELSAMMEDFESLDEAVSFIEKHMGDLTGFLVMKR